MKLRTRIGNAFRALAGKQKSYSGVGGFGNGFSYGGFFPSNHPIIKAITDCTAGDPNTDPRDMIDYYRVLWYALPWSQIATTKLIDISGEIVPNTGDPKLDMVVGEIIEKIPILHPNSSEPVGYGLNQLDSTFRALMRRDGMAFTELEFLDDMGRDPRGVVTFDPKCLYYEQNANDMLEVDLWLSHDGTRRKISGDPRFSAIRNRFDGRFIWGRSVLDGLDLFAEAALYMVISRKNYHIRHGNPLAVDYVGVDERDSMELSQGDRDDIKAFFDNYAEASKNGMKAQMEGKPVHLIHSMPYPVKVTSSTYGQGVSGVNDWRSDVDFIGRFIMESSGVPAQLGGFAGETSGIGSDQFRIGLGTMRRNGAREAKKMDDELHLKTIRQYMAAIGESPRAIEAVKIARQAPELASDKEQAETIKAEADALKVQLENLMQIRMDMASPDAAQRYASEIGLEIDAAKIPDPIFDPLSQ